jgi:serine/threonine-protein kinase RsbW
MATVEVSFTPLPAHVRTARLVATAVARRGGVPESLLDEVRLAVGEACSRAVEEHQRHCPGVPVHIRLVRDEQRFEVTVTDAAGTGPGASASGTGAGVAGAGAGVAGAGAGVAGAGGAGSPATTRVAGNGAAANGSAAAGDAGPAAGGLPDDEAWSSGVGMAVIAGLADDVQIASSDAGLAISMSWNCRATSDSILH